MAVHGWTAWLNAAQLIVAGLAAMVAIQQVAVWHWEGRGSPARRVATTAGLTVVVLVSNMAMLATSPSPYTSAWFVVRGFALAAAAASALPLADVVSDRRPPRLLGVAIMAIIALRLLLLVTTHLLYAYRVTDGLPEYGALSTPTGVLLIVALLSYLVLAATRGRPGRERTVLATGMAATLAISVLSFLTTDRLLGELLTGYLTLPVLAAFMVSIWLRQTHAQRLVASYAGRQQALANLGRLALTASLDEVCTAARAALTTHLPAVAVPAALAALEEQTEPETDDGWHPDREFVLATTNVVLAARHRQEASDELVHRATHDELTGLPNRSQLRSLIDQALGTVAGDASVAVACCNLVRFKTINDAYGHSVGDQILLLVGRRLREMTWQCDRVGRFGSDEFVVVCDDPTSADSTDALIDRIHGVFAQPVLAGDVSVSVSASVGVVLATQDDTGVDADSLLRDAVTAMHDAKSRGTATGRFRQELRAAVVYRADIEQRLVGAVARGEIAVFYQPVVDLGTGAIAGFEALARWERDGRHIPPAEWIPIAETTDLIHEIGEHVLVTAAGQTAWWRGAGYPVSISVNVSARQMATSRIEDSVRLALELVPADALVIEVTESLALDESAQRALHWLRTLGVRTALDDFGTGFSSLAAAARLPIDSIKIDQSITKRVTHPDGNALVGATVAIARALGLTVVAEGIESLEQQQATSELGCQYGQGYLFSRPVPAEQATEQLRSLTASPFIVQRQAH